MIASFPAGTTISEASTSGSAVGGRDVSVGCEVGVGMFSVSVGVSKISVGFDVGCAMVGWGAVGWEGVEVGAQPTPIIKLETMITVRLFIRVVILELGIIFFSLFTSGG